MTEYAPGERIALADLLERLGPDAPTLDEGWTTRGLAAHLLLRDRRPDAAVGILVKPLAAYTRQVQRLYAAKPWPEVLRLLREGPPRWSPYHLPGAGELANLVEYFVHHEDVRRAQQGWAPRQLDSGKDDALWKRLPGLSKLLYRRSPVGVLLRRDSGETYRARTGTPEVTVLGPAQEILLHAFGRGKHARVEVEGDPVAVARFATTPLGV